MWFCLCGVGCVVLGGSVFWWRLFLMAIVWKSSRGKEHVSAGHLSSASLKHASDRWGFSLVLSPQGTGLLRWPSAFTSPTSVSQGLHFCCAGYYPGERYHFRSD